MFMLVFLQNYYNIFHVKQRAETVYVHEQYNIIKLKLDDAYQ